MMYDDQPDLTSAPTPPEPTSQEKRQRRRDMELQKRVAKRRKTSKQVVESRRKNR